MSRINIAEARAHLGELLERAAEGERIVVTKRGRPLAQISQTDADLQPVRLGDLQAISRRTPEQAQSADELMRELRDDARY